MKRTRQKPAHAARDGRVRRRFLVWRRRGSQGVPYLFGIVACKLPRQSRCQKNAFRRRARCGRCGRSRRRRCAAGVLRVDCRRKAQRRAEGPYGGISTLIPRKHETTPGTRCRAAERGYLKIKLSISSRDALGKRDECRADVDLRPPGFRLESPCGRRCRENREARAVSGASVEAVSVSCSPERTVLDVYVMQKTWPFHRHGRSMAYHAVQWTKVS